MTKRSITVLVLALATLILAGCASEPAANGVAASIPSDRSPLSGTWHGSATEVGSGTSLWSADYRLHINDDGTWTLTMRPRGGAAVEYSGTSSVRGNRIKLSETNGPRSITLMHSGRRLYGIATVNSWGHTATESVASRPVMLEFTRSEQ
jgi:hypothetical protein